MFAKKTMLYWLFLLMLLLNMHCLTVYADEGDEVVAHIQAQEESTQEDLNVTTLGENLNAQLNVAKKLGILLFIIVIVGVIVCYREPNKFGFSVVLHTNKKDSKTLKATVKASKKIPSSVQDCEVMSLMYGLVDNKYLLLPQCILDFINKGYFKVYAKDKHLYIRPSDTPPEITKKTPVYITELLNLINQEYSLEQMKDLFVECSEKVDTILDSYVSETMKALDKTGLFAWGRKVHGVRVYYTSTKTRQFLLDILKILRYYDTYGVENLESSTMDKDIVDYARLIILLNVDMEANTSVALKNTLLIGRQLQKAVCSAFQVGDAA